MSDGYIDGYERGYTTGRDDTIRVWQSPPTNLKSWRSLFEAARQANELIIVSISGAGIDDLIDGLYYVDSFGGMSDDTTWVGIDPLGKGWSTCTRHVRSVLRIPMPLKEQT